MTTGRYVEPLVNIRGMKLSRSSPWATASRTITGMRRPQVSEELIYVAYECGSVLLCMLCKTSHQDGINYLVQIQATTPAGVFMHPAAQMNEGHTPPDAPGETLRIPNSLGNALRRSLSMMRNISGIP